MEERLVLWFKLLPLALLLLASLTIYILYLLQIHYFVKTKTYSISCNLLQISDSDL